MFPWALTPLIARVIAGWMMLLGVGGLMLSREPRWSGWRVVLESLVVGITFALLALPFAWSDFNATSVATWVHVAILGVGLAGIAGLYAGRAKTYGLLICQYCLLPGTGGADC